MRAEAKNIEELSLPPEICISHNGQSVSFNVSYYNRKAFAGFDLFEQINNYWEGLPEEKQQKIFMCYAKIKASFECFMNRIAISKEVSLQARELLNLHDIEDFRTWLMFKGTIVIPAVLNEEFIYDVDRHNTPEQTYTKPEYIYLISLTLIFRTMMPVWGEFIHIFQSEIGNDYKEEQAYKLVFGCDLENHSAYKKLCVYCDKTIGDDRYNARNVLDSISPEDFADYAVARVIVRRLCLADIRGLDPRATVVTYIHRYVKTMTTNGDSNIDNQIKSKTADNSGSDSIDNKLSSLEYYRIKQSTSGGELAEIEFSLQNHRALAYKLTSKMTDELLDACMESAEVLYAERIMSPQVTLLQWLFKPVVSPRGLWHVDKRTMARCLAVGQAVLWARGHKWLALLITAHAAVHDDALVISNLDSRKQIPADIYAELDRLYPFQGVRGGKKTGYKNENYAVKSINLIVDELAMYPWFTTANERFVQEELGVNTKKLLIPAEIKVILAKFVIEIGGNSWI